MKHCFFLIPTLLCFFLPSLSFAVNKAPGCQGSGPQSPRDISQFQGSNATFWNKAPRYDKLNLCNIHFHRGAEHKASGYRHLVGEGDHRGYSCGKTSVKTTKHQSQQQGGGCHGIQLGDTVEVHWVFTSCDVKPGAALGACLSKQCANPQQRS